MIKYLAILSLGLCACGGSVNAAPLARTTTPAQPVVPHAEVVLTLDIPVPVDVELSNGRKVQAVRCADELDCFQRLTGLCPNGYQGGQMLHGGDKVVGVLFRCVTDQEKADANAQAAQEKAEQAAWQAVREQRLRAAQEAVQKKDTTGGVKPEVRQH